MDDDIKNKVIEALSDHLGLETADISEDDSFEHDLHMRASDLSDFMTNLEALNIATDGVDLTETETVADLIEALGGEAYQQENDDQS